MQIKADPGKDALSVQSDILWVQVGDLYLEASLEDLRYSRQVVNFQHLLLIRADKTLHGRETRESWAMCNGLMLHVDGQTHYL